MVVGRTGSSSNLAGGFPFSLAASVGEICFVSGMPALGPEGSFVAGSFLEELALAWENVANIIEARGLRIEEVVFVQCVLADIGDYDLLNSWWRERFPEPALAPARFTFQAAALPFGAKLELQVVAAAEVQP